MRQRVTESLEVDQGDVFARHPLALASRKALGSKREFEVLLDGQPREERRLLEHQEPLRAGAIDRAPIDRNVPAAGSEMPGQGVEQSGFAAPRWAEQANELTGVNVDVDVLQRLDVRVAVPQLRDGDLGEARAALKGDEQTTAGETTQDLLKSPTQSGKNDST